MRTSAEFRQAPPQSTFYENIGLDPQTEVLSVQERLNPELIAMIDLKQPPLMTGEEGAKLVAELELGAPEAKLYVLDCREVMSVGAYMFPFGTNLPVNKVDFLVLNDEFKPIEEHLRTGLGIKSIRQGEPQKFG